MSVVWCGLVWLCEEIFSCYLNQCRFISFRVDLYDKIINAERVGNENGELGLTLILI